MFGLFKKKRVATPSGAELAMEGLRQIKLAISKRAIEIQQGNLFPDIYVYSDDPSIVQRFSYVMFSPIIQNEVIARCAFVFDRLKDGAPVWQIDWAVLENYRGSQWGKNIVTKAMMEFTSGMHGQFPGGFWIEAVVEHDNTPSIKIAEKIIGNGESMEGKEKNLKIFNYIRKFN